MSLIRLEDVYKIYGEGEENQVNALDGVTASVDLESKTAVVTGSASDEALKKAVEDAGYQVTSIQ